MKVYIGADHRGYQLAQKLITYLHEKGIEVEHVGQALHSETDDYVDFAQLVGENVAATQEDRGIAICGSGVGVDIAANKIKGVRSVLGSSEKQVQSARNDDDVNVLSLGSDFLTDEEAKRLTTAFLETPFAKEERFIRRRDKLTQLEQ